MLAQKDERIEAMHSQAIARERLCKAAEVFSVTLVAELEAIRSALDLFRLAEAQTWADAVRHTDASHARALSELEKILKEAHTTEVALLTSVLQEQQRLKDEALSRVQQLLEGEASTSDSVKKFLTDMRAKDLELANMRTLLDQKDNEIKLIHHQKATEMKLLASEHLVQLKSKDAELLKELETLSKAKMSEMEQALAKLRAEMKSKEDACEALLKKKDADLVNLEDKHKAELESLNGGMSKKVDDLWAQLKAKEADYDELQRKFESSGDSLRSELDQREEALRVLQRKLEDSRGEIDRIGNERDSQKRRLEICERDSAAEIARLQAEIERLRALLDQERERRRDLEEKLRLAEEAAKRANKLVGIGMRITDEAPHRVTELVEGGAAYLSGAIQVGDYILQVANMDASKHSIADIRNCVLGPAGSYLDLKLDRRGEDDEPNVFTVNIKRAEITPTGPSVYDMCMKVNRIRT
jgi:C-terminal processing protease CtpA/Prc